MTNWGKNEDEDEKIWENELDFWILHIKIRFNETLHKNLWKKCLTQVLGNFWLIEAKTKMKMKKYGGEMSSIFGFSISKLGCVAIFIKLEREKNWPIV